MNSWCAIAPLHKDATKVGFLNLYIIIILKNFYKDL